MSRRINLGHRTLRRLRPPRSVAGRTEARKLAEPSGKDRINALISVCKANWLALMSYLAFVGVMLMGVTDADFFMPERQTQLPLIGVTIPTLWFMGIAPMLGFMLYAHLHFYLMRLWDALRREDAPGSETITPWLVADFALSGRDQSVARFPLQWLVNWVVFAMIFLAAPIVLTGFWWRSMPKHDGWLTLLWCGVPLFGSILVGMKSWLHLRQDRTSRWRWLNRNACWVVVFLLILAAGWVQAVNMAPRDGETEWQTLWPDLLSRAQLAGMVFVETPDGWLPRDEAEQVFRREWCKQKDITVKACGPGPLSDAAPASFLDHQRQLWCNDTLPAVRQHNTAECEVEFDRLSREYESDWRKARSNALALLPQRNLVNADLRGANLWEARLEGLELRGARLEGAFLTRARLEGANLWGARLEGADLREARLEGAGLLWTAELSGSALGSFDLTEVDLSKVEITQEQINTSFGDASVILPEGINRPDHWPEWKLGMWRFDNEWHRWRTDPASYTPPPPPDNTAN